MKNILKSVCIALAACFAFASCGDTYTISATANDPSMGTVSGGGVYALDETVTLTATPNDGFQFLNWNDGNTSNPRTITVSGNAEYVANFQAIPAINGVSVVFDGETLPMGWNDMSTNGQLFLIQAAQSAQGSNVQLPFIVNFLEGTSASDMVMSSCELYHETFYTMDDDQYGDWQFESNTSMNISNFDATSLEMAGNFVNSMWSLTEYVDGVVEDHTQATHKNVSVTFNGTFELVQEKAMNKMIVK